MSSADPTKMTPYRRLLTHVRPYWGLALMAVIGLVLEALGSVGFAALMEPILDQGIMAHNTDVIAMLPFAIIGVLTARGIGGYAAAYGLARVGRSVVRDLRSQLFNRFLQLPSRFFDRNKAGDTISLMNYTTELLAQASTNAVAVLLRDSLTIVFMLALMLYHSVRLTLAVLVIGPLIGWVVSIVSKRFRIISKELQNSMGGVSQVTEEVVQGNRVVKVFDGADQEQKRFSNVNAHNRHQHIKLLATTAASSAIVQIIAAVALAVIVWLATREAAAASLNAGAFMAFVTAMLAILPSLKNLTKVQQVIARGATASADIFAVLDQQLEQDNGTKVLQRSSGEIRYHNVSFTYPETEKPVLKDVSFSARSGSVIAIVGRSGSGKSSLVSLLPRFYDPTEGTITLDDIPLADLKLANLREQIALVSQDVVLFNDTIRANIAYGRLAKFTDSEILDAARSAHCDEFIEKLPEGLDTMVGDRGILLSGGQRQRLAIARAILKDAPILILDEATSALDSESEKHIQAALEQVMQARTTLVIAHRLSTIEHADQVLVMDQGQIVEQGSHQALLKQQGIYAQLHALQFQG